MLDLQILSKRLLKSNGETRFKQGKCLSYSIFLLNSERRLANSKSLSATMSLIDLSDAHACDSTFITYSSKNSQGYSGV